MNLLWLKFESFLGFTWKVKIWCLNSSWKNHNFDDFKNICSFRFQFFKKCWNQHFSNILNIQVCVYLFWRVKEVLNQCILDVFIISLLIKLLKLLTKVCFLNDHWYMMTLWQNDQWSTSILNISSSKILRKFQLLENPLTNCQNFFLCHKFLWNNQLRLF